MTFPNEYTYPVTNHFICVHPFTGWLVYPLTSQNRTALRSFSAIILSALFAFSQYARELDYLGCSFLNKLRTESAKCDCEKKVPADEHAKKTSSPKTHIHNHFDDFFSLEKDIRLKIPLCFLIDGNPCTLNVDLCNGISRTLLRPPDC